MTIKQVAITVIKKKSDPDQTTIPVIISGGTGQWDNIRSKQQVVDKFNAYEVSVTPSVDFGLISTYNYKLRIVNNTYKLFAVPDSANTYHFDFSFIRMSENNDIKTMTIGIYYLAPNIYLDQITGTNNVNYTLQQDCNLAMKENRGVSLKIDRYLNGNDGTCISDLWRYGVENNANDELTTPDSRQLLVTKLFNKL